MSYAKWFAKFYGTTLGIQEDAYYKAAIWAPLVEKAFARYAERFGQYGGAFTGNQHAQADANGNPLSGYQQIDGGVADYVYNILYGGSVVSHGTDDIAFSPDGDPVGANRSLIENLLRLKGEGVPTGQKFMMTVGMDSDEAVNRLDRQTASTLGRPDIGNYRSFARELRFLQARIGIWRGESNATKKAAALEKVAGTAADWSSRATGPSCNPTAEVVTTRTSPNCSASSRMSPSIMAARVPCTPTPTTATVCWGPLFSTNGVALLPPRCPTSTARCP